MKELSRNTIHQQRAQGTKRKVRCPVMFTKAQFDALREWDETWTQDWIVPTLNARTMCRYLNG